LQKLGEDGRLIGIDQDDAAIKAATQRLEKFNDKVTIVRNNYSNIKEVLEKLGIEKVTESFWILAFPHIRLTLRKEDFLIWKMRLWI
jgi:16S rRNA C1402 N4-methylase RsmH